MTRPSTFSLPLVLAFIAPAIARAAAPGSTPAPSPVSIQIAADTSAIAPGKPFTLAVTLTTLAHWHIYWSNPGESGIATSFSWKLPPGFSAEPLPLPIPTAFIQPGNITTYGYTGKTTYLFKITPAPDATAADFSATANITWLCCNKDECLPGKAAASLTLPRAATPDAAKPANADLFTAARVALPAGAPPADIFAMAQPYPLDAPEQYGLQIGWSKKPDHVEIFPPNIEGLDLTIVSTATDAGQPHQGPLTRVSRTLAGDTRVEMKAHVLVGQKVPDARIPLLIVYTLPGDNTRHAFTIPLEPAALGIKP